MMMRGTDFYGGFRWSDWFAVAQDQATAVRAAETASGPTTEQTISLISADPTLLAAGVVSVLIAFAALIFLIMRAVLINGRAPLRDEDVFAPAGDEAEIVFENERKKDTKRESTLEFVDTGDKNHEAQEGGKPEADVIPMRPADDVTDAETSSQAADEVDPFDKPRKKRGVFGGLFGKRKKETPEDDATQNAEIEDASIRAENDDRANEGSVSSNAFDAPLAEVSIERDADDRYREDLPSRKVADRNGDLDPELRGFVRAPRAINADDGQLLAEENARRLAAEEAARRLAADRARLEVEREADFERRKLAAAIDQSAAKQDAAEIERVVSQAVDTKFEAFADALDARLDSRLREIKTALDARQPNEPATPSAIRSAAANVGAAGLGALAGAAASGAFAKETEEEVANGAPDMAIAPSRDLSRDFSSAQIPNSELHGLVDGLRRDLDSAFSAANARMDDMAQALSKLDQLDDSIAALRGALQRAKMPPAVSPTTHLADILRDALPTESYALNVRLASGARADCLVNLPAHNAALAVDGRFPVEAYGELRSALISGDRTEAASTEFRRIALRHIVDTAERLIAPPETVAAAICFLPSESMLTDLQARFPDIVQDAYRANVWFTSPTTLVAALQSARAFGSLGSEHQPSATGIQSTTRPDGPEDHEEVFDQYTDERGFSDQPRETTAPGRRASDLEELRERAERLYSTLPANASGGAPAVSSNALTPDTPHGNAIKPSADRRRDDSDAGEAKRSVEDYWGARSDEPPAFPINTSKKTD
ncbi:MAG: DNA recombination protein RmuC [Pseudomonadota bacterium]